DRGLPRTMGHKAGVETVQKIVTAAAELNFEVLTVYAFSTENWKRPPLEVKTLMMLLKTYLLSELKNLVSNNVRLHCIGQTEMLPKEVRDILTQVIDDTAGNTGLILNLALSYGSRNEIIRAVGNIARQCLAGTLQPDDITEDILSTNLDTADLPDPDLLIRTGGESRLSNFLLWQASYAEILIYPKRWPDFGKKDLIEAIGEYQGRQRRFGKTGEQVSV
ncbi:polyprenyl diphosphate synthase, partial [Thermodesulfobacteriota bacterium]